MPCCSFIKCTNHSGNEKKSTGITFHSFPKDKLWRQKWLKIARKQRREFNWEATNNSRVCSLHFKPEDIYVTKKGLNRIKEGAVPFIQSEPPSSSLQLRADDEGEEDEEDEEDDEDPKSSAELVTRTVNRDNVEKSRQDVPDHQLHLKRTDYKCNECDKDIFGYRYVCVQCAGWAVCAGCEARGAHALHYVLRVPADKPQHEAETVLEKIRQIVNIEMRENQDVPLDELDSMKCEIETSSDPLEDENVVKIEIKEEPPETSELERAPLTDQEPTVEGNAQLAGPEHQQRRKRKASSDTHTDTHTHTHTHTDTLPDTRIRISSDRVPEVTAKRNKTQSSRDPVPSSSKTMNDPTPQTYKVLSDTEPNVTAPMTFHQVPSSVVPVIMYNIPICEDRSGLRPEGIHTSTSSSQALVVSFNPSQPPEDLVIKTELPD